MLGVGRLRLDSKKIILFRFIVEALIQSKIYNPFVYRVILPRVQRVQTGKNYVVESWPCESPMVQTLRSRHTHGLQTRRDPPGSSRSDPKNVVSLSYRRALSSRSGRACSETSLPCLLRFAIPVAMRIAVRTAQRFAY